MRNDYRVFDIKDVLSKGKIDLLNEVREFKQVKIAEDSGAFIAGGFVRHLLSSEDGRQYGDIDLFFTKSSNINFINSLDNKTDTYKFLKSGRGPFAFNHFITNGFRNEKIQFVDHPTLIKDSIYDTLDSFDLVNCKAGILNGKIVVHKDLMNLNDRKVLKIQNNVGPLLLSRILKYSRCYEFCQLESNSAELINDWFIKAKSEFKDDKIVDDNEEHKAHISGSIKSIRDFVLNINLIKNISPDDITNIMFFLGNFKTRENTWENYSENGFSGRRLIKSIEVDPIAKLYGS